MGSLDEVKAIAKAIEHMPSEETLRQLLSLAGSIKEMPKDDTLRDLIPLLRQMVTGMDMLHEVRGLVRLLPLLQDAMPYLKAAPSEATLRELLTRLPPPEDLRNILDFVKLLRDDKVKA